MEDLNKKRAVVTGASSGIGKAICIGLARAGVCVHMVGRSNYRLGSLARQIESFSGCGKYYQADFSQKSDLERLSREIKHDLTRIDILVHCAGFFSRQRFENSTITEFDQHFSVNVRAPYYLTQKWLSLIGNAHGQIIFVNSSAALRTANRELGQYTMTKYALKAFADSLRDEINTAGIRVITIYPGRTATPMQKKIHKMEGRKYNPADLLQPEDIAETLIGILALPRTAEVTDVSIRPFKKMTG